MEIQPSVIESEKIEDVEVVETVEKIEKFEASDIETTQENVANEQEPLNDVETKKETEVLQETEEQEEETKLTENMKTVDNEELPNFEQSDYDPFADPIVERSYNQQTKTGEESTEQKEADSLNLEETTTPLDDLNPKTKRRAAEQTADAILKGYKQFAPEPFKWWCKFPESKIEQMTFEGEIDPNIEVEQGVTFEQYMKQTNEQLDEIFEVQDETLEEIKEPLVEVLMEQQLELTPQQRLGMAVLSHLVQMFTMAMKLWGQNKRILEYQKHLTQMAYQARAETA